MLPAPLLGLRALPLVLLPLLGPLAPLRPQVLPALLPPLLLPAQAAEAQVLAVAAE